MSVSLGELAVRFGCELRGDPDTRVDGIAALADAHARAISFLAHPRYRRELAHTRAAAVVLEAAVAAECPVASLVCENPHATYARMAAWLHPLPAVIPGIHPSAIIGAEARVDPSAHVGPFALIGAGAEIGARAFIGPHCIVAAGVRVGEDSRLIGRVTLGERVTLGPRVLVHAGAVAGRRWIWLCIRARRMDQSPAVGWGEDRRRCGNRRQHHHRSRRDRRYRH
jgi:UDP-3-O-[3-hydroxymyristoyl] glucosamine N-acyltransferase